MHIVTSSSMGFKGNKTCLFNLYINILFNKYPAFYYSVVANRVANRVANKVVKRVANKTKE